MKTKIITLALMLAVLMPAQAEKHEKYSWDKDLKHRLLRDFRRSHEEVKQYIQRYLPYVTDEEMNHWEQTRALETMVIDGRKLYFRNAGPNLFRIDSACVALKEYAEGPIISSSEKVYKENVPLILKEASASLIGLAQPKRMRIHYTLTIDADAIPAGEKIRCWLPYPRHDVPRQQDVKFISASEPKYKFSDPSCVHSTIYMEKKAQAGRETQFGVTFEYTSYGQRFDLRPELIKPYDTSSKLYKEYTSEREKHIIFTPRLRRLADSLTAGETNPLLKAKKMFRWINDHYPWASAREYSTLENIPMYVLENNHGDCGQVTLLFVTLCRICGIPAHFQSGFMVNPANWDMHDWGEIYFEGIGWVPVDQSFGVPAYARNEAEEWFYVGGIDSWRLVVNSDYGMPLSPKKKYPRSETVDFQRGEVEWAGGNIYFDQWDYNMDIDFLDN